MILCEWDAPEGDPGQSCVHLFLVDVFQLSFNFLCPLLLYSIYLNDGALVDTVHCSALQSSHNTKFHPIMAGS
jgi:hypothetical protein